MSDQDPQVEAPKFLPEIPERFFDVEARIEELNSMLDEPSIEPEKKQNIQATIKMYQNKVLPKKIGELVYIQDGKICPGWPDFERHFLGEGSAMQMMQAAHTPVDNSSVGGYQLFQSASFPISDDMKGHAILVRMRLAPRLGGDGMSMVYLQVLNDTGSTMQTIHLSDLQAMGFYNTRYAGVLGTTRVQTANGIVSRMALTVEMQVVRQNGTAVSRWFEEGAVVVPQQSNVPRLSGSQLRNVLYFATAPGNQALYVAEKKTGLCSQLPAI